MTTDRCSPAALGCHAKGRHDNNLPSVSQRLRVGAHTCVGNRDALLRSRLRRNQPACERRHLIAHVGLEGVM